MVVSRDTASRTTKMTTATPQEVLAHIRSQGLWWIGRFIVVCLGNPFLFFLTFPAMLSLVKESWLTAKTVDSNITWLNPVTYFLISFSIYIIWISSNCTFFKINLDTFLENYVSVGAIIVSTPGLINLSIFCTVGMEGNAFGFLFVLPLLAAAAVNLCMWIRALRSAWAAQDDSAVSQEEGTDLFS